MKRGFTLIELLVVVAIIALLASLMVASLGRAQERARDVRRMEDVNTLQKALAIHMASNATYPIAVASTTIDGSDVVTTDLIASQSISAAPLDPIHPTYSYIYASNAIGSDYMIGFCLETDSIPGYALGCTNYVSP